MNNKNVDHLLAYEAKKALLQKKLLTASNRSIQLKKKTASNLFRYIYQKQKSRKAVIIKHFDNILALDRKNLTLDVEGLTSYEKIVNYTLQQGFLPTVAPELKHITVGGAIVGIGIESTGYKYGFVHDGLLEAEVLLPDGRIVLCNPQNEYADLFHALPNSYGTLGYILRAKIKLYAAKPFVHIAIKRYLNSADFIAAMRHATENETIHFIEGLVFAPNEFYLSVGQMTYSVNRLDDIYRKNIFYKLIQTNSDIYLTIQDYIFRYDPDWFWNFPESRFYQFFRQFAPKRWRNSGFYKKYIDKKKRILALFGKQSSYDKNEETLIQDWEVPWEKGETLLQFALEHIDLMGKPWAIIPIKPRIAATLYPLQPETLYFNLGCYCSSKKSAEASDRYHNTKIMDAYCFSLGGLKMLYSSTFLSADEFSNLYQGSEYQRLKQKYDEHNLSGNLYSKVAVNSQT